MSSEKTSTKRTPDEVVRKSGRAAVTRVPDGEQILQIRRGGFDDEPARKLPKDITKITSDVLLRKTGANGGGTFRITRRSGRPLEYYVDKTGMLHVPTGDLDVSSTDEVVDLAKRLVAIHGDPKRPNYTRDGVSVREVANNLWEHALVYQGKHTSGLLSLADKMFDSSLGRKISGGSRADLADINAGDWKMSMAEFLNTSLLDGNRRLDAVRLQEEIRRRRAAGLDTTLLHNMESEDGIVDQETGDFIDLEQEPLETHQDSKGGDAGQGPNTPLPEPASTEPVSNGPRIVINPSVFNDDKDALCVAFNEAFRIIMEVNGFNPVSEPTQKQRRFFSDTAYSQDEIQMRRTILARIATFDTSVSDPTNEQLQETIEFLNTVLEIGAPQNEFEDSAVKQIIEVLTQVEQRGVRSPEDEPEAPSAPDGEGAVQADEGGGSTDDEDEQQSGGQPAGPPQSDVPDPSVPHAEEPKAMEPVDNPSGQPPETDAGSNPEMLAQYERNELQSQYGEVKPEELKDTPIGSSNDAIPGGAVPSPNSGTPVSGTSNAVPNSNSGTPVISSSIAAPTVSGPARPATKTAPEGKDSNVLDAFSKVLSDEAIDKAKRLGALGRIGANEAQVRSLKTDSEGNMVANVTGKEPSRVGDNFLTGGWGGSPKRTSGNMRLTEKGTLRSAAERPSGMSEKEFKNASDADLIKFVQDRRQAKLERAIMRANRSGDWTRVRGMLTDKSNRYEFRNDVLNNAVRSHNSVKTNRRNQLKFDSEKKLVKKKGMKS